LRIKRAASGRLASLKEVGMKEAQIQETFRSMQRLHVVATKILELHIEFLPHWEPV